MTSIKSRFIELDKTKKMKMPPKNRKKMQVAGKGIIGIENTHGNIKIFQNIQFIPNLGYNLLSVG